MSLEQLTKYVYVASVIDSSKVVSTHWGDSIAICWRPLLPYPCTQPESPHIIEIAYTIPAAKDHLQAGKQFLVDMIFCELNKLQSSITESGCLSAPFRAVVIAV